MSSKSVNTFLAYGLPLNVAQQLVDEGLTATAVNATSKANLIQKYNITDEIASFAKAAVARQPVDDEVVYNLLAANNFTCCCCRRADAGYIIHHIEFYSQTQDNSIGNLAVLCPNCHANAHRGNAANLVMLLKPDHIRRRKFEWERDVRRKNAEAASYRGEVHTLDFIHIPRVLELAYRVLGSVPETKSTHSMIANGFMSKDGFPNMNAILAQSNGSYPLNFWGSFLITDHYFQIYKAILQRIEIQSLDDVLNNEAVKSNDFVRKHFIYTGGLYGTEPKTPITDETPKVLLHFRRKGFEVEWLLNPMFMTSATSIWRLGRHTVYTVYGSVRSISKSKFRDKPITKVSMRPYVLAEPLNYVERTPMVAYTHGDTYEDFEQEEDEATDF